MLRLPSSDINSSCPKNHGSAPCAAKWSLVAGEDTQGLRATLGQLRGHPAHLPVALWGSPSSPQPQSPPESLLP